MLLHDVHLLEALDRQYRDRRLKEADRARKLRLFAVKKVEARQDRPEKEGYRLKWLRQART